MNHRPDTAELLNEAMLLLAADPGAVFIGQGVAFDGHAMHASLSGVPASQRIEFPVAEDLQLGASAGLSLAGGGSLVVSIFPRIDFLLRAADQLVNHLDKLPQMSGGRFVPRVLIRTRVGSRTPMDPGPQHSQDHGGALAAMLQWVVVKRLTDPKDVLPVYRSVCERRDRSFLIVEALP